MVTWGRDCLFGEVVDGVMVLNKAGKIVQWEWQNLASSFKFLELGASQVMPNHFHGILLFHEVGATRPGLTGNIAGKSPAQNESPSRPDGSPLRDGSSPLRGPKTASLGAVIGQFKSRVTKRIWKMPEPPFGSEITMNTSSATSAKWGPSGVTSRPIRSCGQMTRKTPETTCLQPKRTGRPNGPPCAFLILPQGFPSESGFGSPQVELLSSPAFSLSSALSSSSFRVPSGVSRVCN